MKNNQKVMTRIRNKSGNVKSKDKLVSFLYVLMRDHLPCGAIEEIMLKHITNKETNFCNGWLANHAKDIAERLK